DIRIKRPSLEDAFIELTGKSLANESLPRAVQEQYAADAARSRRAVLQLPIPADLLLRFRRAVSRRRGRGHRLLRHHRAGEGPSWQLAVWRRDAQRAGAWS